MAQAAKEDLPTILDIQIKSFLEVAESYQEKSLPSRYSKPFAGCNRQSSNLDRTDYIVYIAIRLKYSRWKSYHVLYEDS